MRWSAVMVVGLAGGCDDYIFGDQRVAADEPMLEGLDGVLNLVDTQCLGCHSAGQELGGLDLETDFEAATVDVLGQYNVLIVDPGNPEGSMFYLKITNDQDGQGSDMPPGQGGLGPAATDLVYNWIVSLDPMTAE